MEQISNWASVIITIAGIIISSFLTVKIMISEMKKDIEYLKVELENVNRMRKEDIHEIKIDINEIKKDNKSIISAINDVKVSMAGLK